MQNNNLTLTQNYIAQMHSDMGGLGFRYETFPPNNVEGSPEWNSLKQQLCELLVDAPDKIHAAQEWLEHDGRPVETDDGDVDCVAYLIAEVFCLDENSPLRKKLLDFYLQVCKGTGGVYKLVFDVCQMARA